MRLKKICIKNFRSFTDSGDITIEPLQAFVGENNAGKSNLLRAMSCFLSPGSGGMKVGDFKDVTAHASIECEFGELEDDEKKKLRPYLLGNKVILQKSLRIEIDEVRQKSTVKAEYHGYRAEPANDNLSIPKIEAKHGPRPKWSDIAAEIGITEYVQDENGTINKTTYRKGLERYLQENDVDYDKPELGETQALGIPQNLLTALPKFYLLPAITDYSDEVDRRSSTTVFRRLMSDLAERVMKSDPRYRELDEALSTVHALLNKVAEEGAPARLTALGAVEESLKDHVKKLMPSVRSVSLDVEIDASQDLFSKGVNVKIDDGVLTDVLDKGHGMQRSMVYSLLQMLMSLTRDNADGPTEQPIILAIEEPELYIHPHCQRLIFRALKEFAGLTNEDQPTGKDQVVYTTHSPSFVDVWNYERIGLVRKPDLRTGTIVKQAPAGIIGDADDVRTFKILTSFGLKHNEVFFCRSAILVEGPEDEVGIVAAARKAGRIVELLDELGVTVLVAGGKGDIPKFQMVLNAFEIDYGVLLEMDGRNERHHENAQIIESCGNGRLAKCPRTVEDLVGHRGHFRDQCAAAVFYSEFENINEDLLALVAKLLPPPAEP